MLYYSRFCAAETPFSEKGDIPVIRLFCEGADVHKYKMC
jgi:hypothetical protein